MKTYQVIVYNNGDKIWSLNNKYHREDGPAVEYNNGSKRWYLYGNLHREDGPALKFFDGTKYWYLNGKELSEEEFNLRMNKKQSSCSRKIVEIDGKKYKLIEV